MQMEFHVEWLFCLGRLGHPTRPKNVRKGQKINRNVPRCQERGQKGKNHNGRKSAARLATITLQLYMGSYLIHDRRHPMALLIYQLGSPRLPTYSQPKQKLALLRLRLQRGWCVLLGLGQTFESVISGFTSINLSKSRNKGSNLATVSLFRIPLT